MADIDDYERAPVQHQPNVADDPKGQKSDVRGVPIEPSGKEVDDKTGLPKPESERQRIKDQARENQRK
jgi:hypothetical protein